MHKQGDILLVPIPFSDLTATKKRPVLVLSNDSYNIQTEDIIIKKYGKLSISKLLDVKQKVDEILNVNDSNQ